MSSRRRPSERRKKGATDILVPLVEEGLQVTTREGSPVRVRVRTVTETIEDLVRQELHGERVEVERVPINRMIEPGAATPKTRTEGNVTILPIFEEVLVVEK